MRKTMQINMNGVIIELHSLTDGFFIRNTRKSPQHEVIAEVFIHNPEDYPSSVPIFSCRASDITSFKGAIPLVSTFAK